MDDIKRVKPVPPRQTAPSNKPAPRVIGQQPQPIVEPAPIQPQMVSGGQDTTPSGGGKKFAILTILLILAIGLIAGGVFAYLGSKKQEDKPSTTNSHVNNEDEASKETTGLQKAINDSDRKSHVKEIQAMLETYYNDNDRYPTLQQANEPSTWSGYRGALDLSTVKDPDGTDQGLVGAPAKGSYHYVPKSASGGECDNEAVVCTDFVVGATQSDDNLYEERSAN